MVAVAVVSIGAAQVAQSADRQSVVVAQNKPRLVAAARLVAQGAELLRSQPMPLTNAEVTTRSLAQPSVQSALPSIRPSRQAALDVAANLQVDVRSSTFSFAAPSRYTWQPVVGGRGGRAQLPTGCVLHHLATETSLNVPLEGTPVQVRLTSSGQEITTLLRSRTVQSEPVQWATRPGDMVYVASTARQATLTIVLPPGDATLCIG
jgi:hypothetical protein